ncbi:NAD(P)-binding protein [Amniculicola lignicola CBS 123094]|uniref:NAD(P)-binding protein n=1 Tax=Amniculicola lignicola CBS 123094 TaxID=1392246 RepID=A0A6A5W3F3_9PLEO|nr:NAD(P)-binding protein [Amniculicola lignicola CBS 123094]
MSQDPGQKYANNGNDFLSLHHDTYPAIDPTKADLSGKTVFITGASKGLGLATAISFAKAGASGIAIAARTSLSATVSAIQKAAQEANHPPPTIVPVTLDVTDQKSVEAAAKTVSGAFRGKLDILINNAGYLSPWKPLVESDPVEWWTDFEVNIKGVYLVSRSFIPLVLASPTKIIVNLSSIGAHFTHSGASSYQTTKLAVLRLTEFIAVDYPEILAIAVHPGGVMTNMAKAMPEAFHGLLVDTPELAADSMIWLVKERREWLQGRYVSVCWDVEELEGRREEIIKGDLLKVRMAVNGFEGV